MGLHAEVVREDMEPLLAYGRHLIGGLGGDAARQVEALHEGMREHTLEQVRFVCAEGGDGAPLGSLRSDVEGEGPRIYTCDSDHATLEEIILEGPGGPP